MATSLAFDRNINPPPGEPRRTFAEVVYSFTEPESKEGGRQELPPGNAFSRPWQALNGIMHMSAPVATLEPGNWRLDGSYILPAPPCEQPGLELGWWSAAVSDGNGRFAEPQTIVHEFAEETDFDVLGVVFDTMGGNWCPRFEASFYDFYGGLLHSETVAADGPLAQTARAGMRVKRVEIRLFSTNRPLSFARVAELNFGQSLVFGGGDIISVNALFEADPQGRSIPAPALELRVRNGGRFDVLDPESPLRYFRQRQRFHYRHGLRLPDGSAEWVPVGSFVLEKWEADDAAVTFRAVGASALLEKERYRRNTFEEMTVAEMVRAAHGGAVVSVASPSVTGFFGDVSLKEALAMMAELSCCLVHEDGGGALRFDDVLAGGGRAWPVGYGAMFAPPRASMGGYCNAVELAEYAANAEWGQVARVVLEPGPVEIAFSKPLVGEPEIGAPPGFALEVAAHSATGLSGVLRGEGAAEVAVRGLAAGFSKKYAVHRAPWHNGREETVPYRVDLPCMIAAPGFAEFREWFLRRKFALLAMRLSASLDWRQNPALGVGGAVDVRLRRGGPDVRMRIVRQELGFDGALRGETKAIAAMPDFSGGGRANA